MVVVIATAAGAFVIDVHKKKKKIHNELIVHVASLSLIKELASAGN
jgi:hypothetical protein